MNWSIYALMMWILGHRLLTVRQGKGKKDRQIPLVDEAVKALRNYKRYRNTDLILDDEIFFLAKNGTSLCVSSVKYLVAKYVKQAGIRKSVCIPSGTPLGPTKRINT